MNKAVLPILARLQALQKPSQVAPGGARVIADLAHPNPLATLFRELNETILARSLLVESSGGSSLLFDVAGRRILRLREATGLPDGDGCLQAEMLEDEHKDDVVRLLRSLALPRHELRVTSRPLTGEGDGVSVGLPVTLIAELAGVELNEVAGPEPDPAIAAAPAAPDRPVPVVAMPEPEPAAGAPRLGRFAAELGPALAAWLIRGGAEDGQAQGHDEMLSHLQGFAEEEAASVLAQLDRVAAQPGDPVCLLVGATLVDGHSIVCARAEGGLLLGVIEGDSTPGLARAWAAALG